MRQRVYASSWPILDTTAAAATSSGDTEEAAASDSDAEEATAAVAPIGPSQVPPPQVPPPQVGEPSEDGSTEGEILGAVGVSVDGEVKLYILETLPDEALDQVRPATPLPPCRKPRIGGLHTSVARLPVARVNVIVACMAAL